MNNEKTHPNALKSRLNKAKIFFAKAAEKADEYLKTLITYHGILLAIFSITIAVHNEPPNRLGTALFYLIGLSSFGLYLDIIRRERNINSVKAPYFQAIGDTTLKKGSQEENTAKTHYETTESRHVKFANWEKKIFISFAIINSIMFFLSLFRLPPF
jgi:hypothetical protein